MVWNQDQKFWKIYDIERENFIEKQGFNRIRKSNDQTQSVCVCARVCVNLKYRKNEIKD